MLDHIRIMLGNYPWQAGVSIFAVLVNLAALVYLVRRWGATSVGLPTVVIVELLFICDCVLLMVVLGQVSILPVAMLVAYFVVNRLVRWGSASRKGQVETPSPPPSK